MSPRTDLLPEGLAALSRGWVVTPLNGKRPFLDAWQIASTPSEEDVRRWVNAGYNLGLRTGPVSGVIVMDHDPRHDDGTPLPKLPRTVTACTGGGGSHHLFRCPDDPPPNSSRRIHPALDVKSAGGQVVLAGSIHPDTGTRYRWAEGLHPNEVPLADVPQALLVKMSEARPSAPAPTASLAPDASGAERVIRARAYLTRVPGAISGQGGHNHTFYVACRLILGFELDTGTAMALISEWNHSCEPPWSEKALRHKIDDAARQAGPRGFMLSTPSAAGRRTSTWAVQALANDGKEVLAVPRRVSDSMMALLLRGDHPKYRLSDGALDDSRAVYAAALSLLAGGASRSHAALVLARSALRPVIDRREPHAAAWLANCIDSAREYLRKTRARLRRGGRR